MWRQEDIFFAAMDISAMGMGDPPATPEDLADRVKDTAGTLTMATAAPLMHGAAQWAAFICFHNGQHAGAGRVPEVRPGGHLAHGRAGEGHDHDGRG